MIENGIFNIDKPKGITSHDVVREVRRKLKIKRVGHTGTLDPMATGVLPICFGKATRIIEYYDADFKTYEAELQFGITTDSLDITGEVLTRNNCDNLTVEDIKSIVKEFEGEIEQIPPKYSALKVNGKRLYEYARSGEDVEIKARKTFIKEITITNIDLANLKMSIKVVCSKGTYIRTICDDIGAKLGTGACMTKLVRTRSGYFDIENAITLEEFTSLDINDVESIVIPMEDTLLSLGKAVVDNDVVTDYLNGKVIDLRNVNIEENPSIECKREGTQDFQKKYRMSDNSGEFLGVSIYDRSKECFIAEKIIKQR